MAPLVASALISGVPALLQGATGAVQMAKGNKLARNNQRPMFEIPPAVLQAIQSAKVDAQGFEMAGQDLMEQKLDQTYATQINDMLGSATSGADALSAIIKAGAQRTGAQADLDIAAAQQREREQAELRGALYNLGNYQEKQWEYNELQPFQDKAAQASALKGSGMQNVFGALNTLAGIGAYGADAGLFGEGTKAVAGGAGGGVTDAIGGAGAATKALGAARGILNLTGTTNPSGNIDPKTLSPETASFFEQMELKASNPTLRVNPFEIAPQTQGVTQAPPTTPQNYNPYNQAGGGEFFLNDYNINSQVFAQPYTLSNQSKLFKIDSAPPQPTLIDSTTQVTSQASEETPITQEAVQSADDFWNTPTPTFARLKEAKDWVSSLTPTDKYQEKHAKRELKYGQPDIRYRAFERKLYKDGDAKKAIKYGLREGLNMQAMKELLTLYYTQKLGY